MRNMSQYFRFNRAIRSNRESHVRLAKGHLRDNCDYLGRGICYGIKDRGGADSVLNDPGRPGGPCSPA